MWLDVQTCSVVFITAIITIQRVTEGMPTRSHRPETRITVCGERIRPMLKMVCHGIYANIFEIGSNSAQPGESLETLQRISEKCCVSSCTHSEMRKYCGTPLARDSREPHAESQVQPSTTNKSKRPRSRKDSHYPKEDAQSGTILDRKKSVTSHPKNSVENLDTHNSCKSVPPGKKQRRKRAIKSDETTEDVMLEDLGNAVDTGTERQNRNHQGNRMTEGPVRVSFVLPTV